MEPGRFVLRAVLTALHDLRRLYWRVRGRRGRGVLAVALTPKRRIVLVRLTYARGWRLPGGGVDRGEEPRAAALRELREEIGMVAHGAVACVDAPDDPASNDGSTLFLVEDVRYAPRRTFEVDAVAEFAPDALPGETTALTRMRIEEALPLLRRA